MENLLNDYITAHYQEWVKYAALHVDRAGLSADSSEVVNEVLCYLLERKRDKLERMIENPADALELHYFILRVLRINIYSRHSHFRYRSGPRSFDELQESKHPLVPEDDPCEVHNLVGQILAQMNLSEEDKAIFVWKFFDKKRLSQWSGSKDRRAIYTAYNRVWKKIIREIREKLVANSIM